MHQISDFCVFGPLCYPGRGGVLYGAMDTFWVGRSNLEQACHFGLVLALEIATFWTLLALDRYLVQVKKAVAHALPCIGV